MTTKTETYGLAMFANPYLAGKEEALIIDENGHLTYLQRTNSETGWLQTPVTGTSGNPINASEVVVAVHHVDLSVWAIIIDPTGKPGLLTLTPKDSQGAATCTWQVADSVVFSGPALGSAGKLYLFYWRRQPCIVGVDTTNGNILIITPMSMANGDPNFYGQTYPVSVGSRVDEIVGGANVGGVPGVFVPGVFARVDKTLTYYKPVDGTTAVVSSNATHLVGVFAPGGRGDIGCIFLDTDGNLVTWLMGGGGTGFPEVSTPGLGFQTAAAWVDVNEMVHVYGLDQSNTLKVLRQARWTWNFQPQWTQAKTQDGATTPVCVGIVAGVVGFFLDPFPDYLPSELVKMEATAAPGELFSIYTQDIATTQWSRDKVRLPKRDAPYLVSHYVSEVSVLDGRGVPMPGLPVTVSADSLVEIQVEGASYLVGPGHSAQLMTNGLGKLAIATAATSLLPPTLRVNAAGLKEGAAIQPASDVHEYLAGTGTLSTQKGTFTSDALWNATVNGQRIVNPTRSKGDVDGAVKQIGQVFGQARGPALASRLAAGSATPIHGSAVGSLGGHPQYSAFYHEYRSPEEAEAHLLAIRSAANYGGIWEDFLSFASDVWEGIRNGAIQVANIIVTNVTRVFIKVGEKIVELAHFVIDSIESAVHAVECVFQTVVDAVGKVIDWLKALFAFGDIWDTKTALQSGMMTMISYGDATIKHVGNLASKWFEQKEKEVKDVFEGLKSTYRTQLAGDLMNQRPPLKDASGGNISLEDMKHNPQANWLLNLTSSRAALMASTAGGISLPMGTESPIPGAFAEFIQKIESSGLVDDVKRILGDIETLFTSFASPDDPNAGLRSAVDALLDIPERLALVVLKALDSLFSALVTLAELVLEGIASILDFKLELGPVNTFYEWIQTNNGIKNPEPLTVGGLCFLIGGFVVTTLYKLVNGVDHPPFPGGKFPTIPAPPWHPAHVPSSLSTAGDPTTNTAMLSLQMAAGWCGVIGGVAELTADLAPVVGGQLGGTLDTIIAILQLVFSNGMFTVIPACPPVTGAGWADAGGAWTGQFMVALVNWTLSAGALGTKLFKPDAFGGVAVLKNLGSAASGPTWGPVIATIFGAATITCVGVGFTKQPADSYTEGMYCIAPIPSCIQVVRFGVKPGSIESYVRASVVAFIDIGLNAASAGMLISGCALNIPAPTITPDQTPPNGKVNTPYDYAVTYKQGDDRAFGKAKNWTLVQKTVLPNDLSLDEDTGHITGTPQQAGTFTFKLVCSDSWGPPRYSDPCQLRIQINP